MAANQISILIKANDQASSALGKVRDSVRKTTGETKKQTGIVKHLSDNWATYAGISAAAGVATYGLFGQMKKATREANSLDAALMGLNSIAEAFSQDADAAKRAAQDLASDGLMTVTESATGLKNLLASGFNLDQAVQLMNRFKDSAAFGRQASLDFGQAIASATEGIKNGNSILVDNAGVTKNLSNMLTEAGFSAQDLSKATSDSGVRQAIFQGIMKETNAQVGDAAKLADSAAGKQAMMSAQTRVLYQELGRSLQPALLSVLQTITPFIAGIGEWVSENQSAAATITIVTAGTLTLIAALGVLATALKTAMVLQTGLNAAMSRNPILAVIMLVTTLVGVLGAMYGVTQLTKGATDDLNQSRKTQAQLADEAADAENRLKDAQLQAKDAALQVERAQRIYNDAVARYGPNSLEAREAALRLEQAQKRVRDANREAAAATDENRNAQARMANPGFVARIESAALRIANAYGGIALQASNASGQMVQAAWSAQKLQNAASTVGGSAVQGASSRGLQGASGKLQGNASGTNYARGGLTLVGERGPEIVNLPRGSQVTQAYRTAQTAAQSAGQVIVNITGPVSFQSRSDIDYFAERISKTQRLAKVGMA